MFYYLLAKNVNILKNMEQVASITVIKYIFAIVALKLIEYKYLEPGFLNPYIIAVVIFDILFSLKLHYDMSQEDKTIFWEDDVFDSEFSFSDYKNEFEKCKEDIGKRESAKVIVQKPIFLSESETNIKEKNDESNSELNTCDLEGVINKIISDSKGSKSGFISIDSEENNDQ